jgi:hypothetical protein
MKRIFFGLVLLLSTSAFAANTPVDEQVVKKFQETFPTALDVKWSAYETFYEVVFYNNKIMCRARYDLKGSILSVLRYYYEKDLPHFIAVKLKEKHPGKKIFGITEITSEEGVVYNIVLEDDTRWFHIRSTDSGYLTLTNKYKKA